MLDKLLLGVDNNNENVYLSKHSWDCDWYFDFGYIGNKNFHSHFDYTYFGENSVNVSDHFIKTKITQNQWWVIRDMFMQAYALQRAAEIYKHGGNQVRKQLEGVSDIIRSEEMAAKLNANLKLILDKLWEYLTSIL